MQLAYRLPCTALRSRLSVHALLHDVTQEQIETVPAMLPNLHIRLSGTASYRFGDGPAIEAPNVALIGPTSEAYRMTMQPGITMLATGFLPVGWLTLARIPACDLSDTLADGAEVWGRANVQALYEQLLNAPSHPARFAILERFLAARMQPCNESRLKVAAAVDHWLETSADLGLDELSRQLGIGARHLRRLTLETHGASPKVLAMKYRCLRAAAALSARGTTGFEEALALFADQAHLIRDFHRFIGWTPGEFIGDVHGAAASTLRGRRDAGAHRPLTLLS